MTFQLTALTKEQFDSWDSARKRKYLQLHPASQFGKDRVRSGAVDHWKARVSRVVPKGHDPYLPNKKAKYVFSDMNGKQHHYKGHADVDAHLDELEAEAHAHNALKKSERSTDDANRINDHMDALESLKKNRTFNKDHGKG